MIAANQLKKLTASANAPSYYHVDINANVSAVIAKRLVTATANRNVVEFLYVAMSAKNLVLKIVLHANNCAKRSALIVSVPKTAENLVIYALNLAR